jgi:hypothetical protein
MENICVVNLTNSGGIMFLGIIKENDDLISLINRYAKGDIKMFKYEQQ